MLTKIAFLFPGQGSQHIGMGRDIYEEFLFAKEIFEMTDDIAKNHISRFCFKGPADELKKTINLQPAITAVNLCFLALLTEEGIVPSVCAGHSLGEYAALRAAGIASSQTVVRMVKKRGELMHRESLSNPGGMTAVLGLDLDKVKEIVDESGEKDVFVANHNSEKQVVLSGKKDALDRVSKRASKMKAKCISLEVSGAWHSGLMEGARSEFASYLEPLDLNLAMIPVIHNATLKPAASVREIKRVLSDQLVRPVRWYDTMLRLIEEETEVYVEVGPGTVLTNLMKRTLPKKHEALCFAVNSLRSFEKMLSSIA